MSVHEDSGRPMLAFAQPTDRRTFLRIAGLVGVSGALVAGGVLTAEPADAKTPATPDAAAKSDGDVLNFALTLAHLHVAFYQTAMSKSFFTGRELQLIRPIDQHGAQHVSELTAAIGKLGLTPGAKPSVSFPADTWTNTASVLRNASTLEEILVTAYHGQIALVTTPDVVTLLTAIAGVESRHAAVLAARWKASPFPQPVELQRTKQQVQAIVQPFLS